MVGILDLIPVLGTVIDRVIPDPVQKADLQLKLAALADQENVRQHDEMMGEMTTNTEEAKSSSLFVAGWRPAVGWIGAVGLGYSFVVEPLADWFAKVVFHYSGQFPLLDTGQLMALVTGMLGFGGMRMIEKINKVPDSQPLGVKEAGQSIVPLSPPKRKKFLGIF